MKNLDNAMNSEKPQPLDGEQLKTVGSILGHVKLLRAMDNLNPDDDKTMNRLKKSMNDEANAVLQDQDNVMMSKIMNLTKTFEGNATNRGKFLVKPITHCKFRIRSSGLMRLQVTKISQLQKSIQVAMSHLNLSLDQFNSRTKNQQIQQRSIVGQQAVNHRSN